MPILAPSCIGATRRWDVLRLREDRVEDWVWVGRREGGAVMVKTDLNIGTASFSFTSLFVKSTINLYFLSPLFYYL